MENCSQISIPARKGSECPALVLSDDENQFWPAEAESLLIGSSAACDVRLLVEGVDKVACIVYESGGGWRYRNCAGSLEPTLNGKLVKEALLVDGDLIQLGPCKIQWRMPRALNNATSESLTRRQLFQKAEMLRESFRTLDRRAENLEQGERELFLDQDTLAEGFACLQTRVQELEVELARRRVEAEAKIARRWEEFHQECASWQRQMHPLKPEDPPGEGSSEESKGLNIRRMELDSYAAHLYRLQRRLLDQETDQSLQSVRLAAQRQALKKDRERWFEQKEAQTTDHGQKLAEMAQQRQALAMQQRMLERIHQEFPE
ncbi:MAG: hypothetical protein ACJ8FY_10660 [Gemmataceae bacterium]